MDDVSEGSWNLPTLPEGSGVKTTMMKKKTTKTT
jgi:hypothetical protein